MNFREKARCPRVGQKQLPAKIVVARNTSSIRSFDENREVAMISTGLSHMAVETYGIPLLAPYSQERSQGSLSVSHLHGGIELRRCLLSSFLEFYHSTSDDRFAEGLGTVFGDRT
jgi:hypothetical protein